MAVASWVAPVLSAVLCSELLLCLLSGSCHPEPARAPSLDLRLVEAAVAFFGPWAGWVVPASRCLHRGGWAQFGEVT